jgi:hypothetical protein
MSFYGNKMNQESRNTDLNSDYQQAQNHNQRGASVMVESEAYIGQKMESPSQNLNNNIKNPNLKRYLANSGHGPKSKLY